MAAIIRKCESHFPDLSDQE